MNKILTQAQLTPAKQTTTVFTSGNSQAVRLPKAFRISSSTVEIERRGDEIILRERKRTVGDLLRQLPPLSTGETEGWERIAALIEDPQPQERDWNTLLGPAQPTQAATSPTPRAVRRKSSRA